MTAPRRAASCRALQESPPGYAIATRFGAVLLHRLASSAPLSHLIFATIKDLIDGQLNPAVRKMPLRSLGSGSAIITWLSKRLGRREGRIEHIKAVGGARIMGVVLWVEPVQFTEQLVESLLTLVASTSELGTMPMAAALSLKNFTERFERA